MQITGCVIDLLLMIYYSPPGERIWIRQLAKLNYKSEYHLYAIRRKLTEGGIIHVNRIGVRDYLSLTAEGLELTEKLVDFFRTAAKHGLSTRVWEHTILASYDNKRKPE